MNDSPHSSSTKMARTISFFRAHTRGIVITITLSWAAVCAFVLIPSWREALFYFLFLSALFLMLVASQVFWVGCVVGLGARFIPGKPRRAWLTAIATLICLFLCAYNLLPYVSPWGIPRGDSTHLTLRHVLLEAPFWWWFVGSMAGFGLVILFWAIDRTTRVAFWVSRKAYNAAGGYSVSPTPVAIALNPPSPARRQLLEQAAVAVSALPFVASAYGLLYGRLDVEVTHPRIRLTRLPKAFEGFRIAQLSDFHISPFMTADEIRRCAAIANALKAHLVVLTGDYLADDSSAQGEIVQALAGLSTFET